jgi:hypothetical protein
MTIQGEGLVPREVGFGGDFSGVKLNCFVVSSRKIVSNKEGTFGLGFHVFSLYDSQFTTKRRKKMWSTH